MQKRLWRFLFIIVLFFGTQHAMGRQAEGTLAFTVSMDNPNTHYYHVIFRCQGLPGETQDFKMPAWTRGITRSWITPGTC